MSMIYTILGMLANKPLTGYDIRKIILNTPFLYWSGNTNQIYKALFELADEEYVVSESVHQEGAPSKKVYKITADGLKKLREWTMTAVEEPDIRNNFFSRLAFSDQLSGAQLASLLDEYSRCVRAELLTLRKNRENRLLEPLANGRASAVWGLIDERIVALYESELSWVAQVKSTIETFADKASEATLGSQPERTEKSMKHAIVEKNGVKFIRLIPEQSLIEREEDALTLVSLCMEHNVTHALLPSECLSKDFMRLSTGVAGAVLQKLTQYHIKTVAVINTAAVKGKFTNFLAEANSGNMFRAYDNYEDAENWLTGGDDK